MTKDNKTKCIECGNESNSLEESRNGLTCYSCREEFDRSYDDCVDPLGLRH